jgi:hypothetical protein
MPRSSAKTRAPPAADSEIRLRTLSDLLEDTVLLAAEEGAAVACASFTEYICAALPPDMLDSLAELMGGDGGDGSGGGADWLLKEIWEERFAPKDEADACADADAPSDCQVCERRVTLTRHHLFPREMHKFCLKRGVATADELERRVLHCCRLCHNAIHRFFTNEDLALRYHTLELLLNDDKFFRFARWNASQPAGRNGKCR